MKWTKLKDKQPDESIEGQKVLILRKLNEQQVMQSLSIHDTKLIKHCDPEETWWMRLPDVPVKICKHGKQIKGCIRWADTCFDCKNESNQLTQTL